MDTKGGNWQGVGGVMNWEIGIDIYTLMCIKWMTNKKLLYKIINKIKFKRKRNSHIIFPGKQKRKENLSKGQKSEWHPSTVG